MGLIGAQALGKYKKKANFHVKTCLKRYALTLSTFGRQTGSSTWLMLTHTEERSCPNVDGEKIEDAEHRGQEDRHG